jgi:hypothetical protein
MKNVPGLYQHYHSERNDERLELFEIVRAEYGTDSFLYPGCFVHVTPAFVMPNATFVDADKRARRFFDDPQTLSFVRGSRRYRERADLQFLWRDYTDELPIHRGYDLLISQYAGFVSESCKRYLRKGGVLLANNSHGDASLASIDEDFRLIAVIQRRGEHFWVSTSRLDEYFVPAKQVEVTRQLLHATKRGIGYKRSASDYVLIAIAPNGAVRRILITAMASIISPGTVDMPADSIAARAAAPIAACTVALGR